MDKCHCSEYSVNECSCICHKGDFSHEGYCCYNCPDCNSVIEILAIKPEIKEQITSFRDKYSFLSNFFPCLIHYDGEFYPSVEHAYQAAKTNDPFEKRIIKECPSPAQAKKLGRKVTLRDDFEAQKVDIMRSLLIEKFKEPSLKEALEATKNIDLVEGNTWGDVFWGICNGEGQNMLGKLLMEIRDQN